MIIGVCQTLMIKGQQVSTVYHTKTCCIGHLFFEYEMCNYCNCLSLDIMNGMLSCIIILMNSVYALWGMIIPNPSDVTEWKKYASHLELYLRVTSYTSFVLVPLKIMFLLLIHCCYKCKHDESDSIDLYTTQQMYSTNKCTVSTFQMPE